jgi:hypothetical protein
VTKKTRALKKLATISSAWAKEVEDKKNGHTHQSRMAAPTAGETNVGGSKDVERVEIMAISAEQAFCEHKMSVARSTRVRMWNEYRNLFHVSCLNILKL